MLGDKARALDAIAAARAHGRRDVSGAVRYVNNNSNNKQTPNVRKRAIPPGFTRLTLLPPEKRSIILKEADVCCFSENTLLPK